MLIRSVVFNSAESTPANKNSFTAPQQHLPKKPLQEKDVFFGRRNLESVVTTAFSVHNPPVQSYLPPTPAGGGKRNPLLGQLTKGHYLENATVPLTVAKEKKTFRKPLGERKQ